MASVERSKMDKQTELAKLGSDLCLKLGGIVELDPPDRQVQVADAILKTLDAAYAAGVEDAAKKVEGNTLLHNHLNGLCSNCKGAAEIRKLTQK